MPEGKHKSRSLRIVHRRTPGGRNVIHYSKRKPTKAHCAGCGEVLRGVARARPAELSKMAKSSRRPQRPYGGMLCSTCTRRTLVENARK